MSDFDDLLLPYRLKEVERHGVVGDRRESVAEHVFSSMMLARTLLKRFRLGLDEDRVLLLLLYHDLMEVESGDTMILDERWTSEEKRVRERDGAQKVASGLPIEIREEFLSCFDEFHHLRTPEAHFARAVEHLDPILDALEQPELWKKYGFTAKVLREKKGGMMQCFPEVEEFFESLLVYAEEQGLFADSSVS